MRKRNSTGGWMGERVQVDPIEFVDAATGMPEEPVEYNTALLSAELSQYFPAKGQLAGAGNLDSSPIRDAWEADANLLEAGLERVWNRLSLPSSDD